MKRDIVNRKGMIIFSKTIDFRRAVSGNGVIEEYDDRKAGYPVFEVNK